MNGTVLCGVEDSAQGRRTVEVGREISERLGLRLVVAHVVEVADASAQVMDEVFWRDRKAANALLTRALTAAGLDRTIARRVEVGDVAGRLAQIAAEEAADLIVIGGRRRGGILPRIACGLADKLESETPVPVLVTLPRLRTRTEMVEEMQQEARLGW